MCIRDRPRTARGKSGSDAKTVCFAEDANDVLGIDEVKFEGMEKISICPDSGSCRNVGPKWMAPAVEVEQSEGSKQGVFYRAANGGKLPNLGQKRLAGLDANGNGMSGIWQMADVTKPFSSVMEMVKACLLYTSPSPRDS